MRTRAKDAEAAKPNGELHAEHPAEAHGGSDDNGGATQWWADSFKGTAAGAAVSVLEAAVADPAALAQPTAELADVMRRATKALHDYSQIHGSSAGRGDGTGDAAHRDDLAAATALHVHGFDAEQIWGQLELQGGALLRRVRKLVSRAGQVPNLLTDTAAAQLDELDTAVFGNGAASDSEYSDDDRGAALEHEAEALDGNQAGAGSSGDSLDDSPEGDSEQGASEEAGDSGGSSEQEGSESDTDGAEHSGPPRGRGDSAKRKAASVADVSASSKAKEAAAKKPRLEVEDDFMKLDDMEAFVQEAERRATAGRDEGESGEDDDSDSEEDGEQPFSDGGVESGSDEEMAALLESSSALVGRKAPARGGPKSKRKAPEGLAGADDSSDEEDADDGMYDSFFDPKPTGRWNRRGEDYDEERSWHEDESDHEENDANPGADGEDWDGGALFDTGEGREAGNAADLLGSNDEGEGEDGAGGGGARGLSKHQRRTAAMQARIAAMEAAAVGDKDWFLRGEAQGEHRPLNSALELDLDFERTMKPPPAPTEDGTKSLEDLIRSRIADKSFDDVVRAAPPAPTKTRTELELDDHKNAKGLGELYEEEYVKAGSGIQDALEERDAEIKAEARALLRALCGRLDALSHFAFAPKPIIEDMAVVAEVPALAMEEVAPQVASAADMRYAGEVFSGGKSLPKGDTELSREDRKRARAGKKRAGRLRRAQKESERQRRTVAEGGEAAVQGRRSEQAARAAADAAKQDKKRGGKKAREASSSGKGVDYTKSTKVFAKITDEQAALKAGGAPPRVARPVGDDRPSAALKL